MTDKSTPRPWRLEPRSLWIMAGEMHVADIRGWGYLTGQGSGALGLPRSEAEAIMQTNAALIVSAVNQHEALMECAELLRAAPYIVIDTSIANALGEQEAVKYADLLRDWAPKVKDALANLEKAQ